MILFAGMPSLQLTDVAKLRLENISFFLAGFLLSAFLIKLLWNYLATDWKFLPRLTYGKALGLVALWGLLFVLVLTMISGARELMTPGAWEKKGATYKLAADAKSKAQERREQLERLKAALWQYANSHEGRLPPTQAEPSISAELWMVPDPSGMTYLYVAGRNQSAEPAAPLAFEPDLFGGERLVLCVDGVIRTMTSDGIAQALAAEKR
ncbi:MAG TPA: hypothetical protein VFE62_20175 [Gemmataceae bacterium]|nr:hypothetical protein [Gemmataceae bacterium]